MPTPLLTSLISSGDLTLYWDLRSGHTLDLSGNGNTGTKTVQWQGNGITLQTNLVGIVSPEIAGNTHNTGTIIIFGDFHKGINTAFGEFIFHNRTGGAFNYRMRGWTATTLSFNDGSTDSISPATTITGSHYIGLNYSNGTNPEYFIEGLSIGNGSTVTALATVGTSDFVGGLSLIGNTYPWGVFYAFLHVHRNLTATEHAQLYGELSNMTWPTKAKGRAQGKYGVELVTNGNMETGSPPTGWIAGNAATLTAQTATRPLAGNQVLRVAHGGTNNPYAFQGVLTPGGTYRVSGWARGDATFAPYVYCGGAIVWTGTLAATWQYFDVKVNSVSSNVLRLYCNANAAGYAEFDNISCREVLVDDTQFKTDWQAHAGDVNFAAGAQLENTPFYVNSGTYQVETDTIEGETCKVITCTGAGQLYMLTNELQETPFQCAYGTWEWWQFKPTTTLPQVFFIASSQTATAGYGIFMNAAEEIGLIENPAATTPFFSAGGYVPVDTWVKIRVTRRQSDSQFSIYMNDILIPAAFGTNPIIDTTIATSEYMSFNLDAGDKIALGDRVGNHNFRKLHGVIAP